ncbi:MAG: alpha/beta hydrolase [Ruminococcus sp.]|nr:alpha/beta hydrolase [Ruminococcus sp.]
MSGCFPLGLLKKSIAKSCTYTAKSYENMLTMLRPYSKKELCRLMGIAYGGFLKENRELDITCPTLILLGEYDRTGKVKEYCMAWSGKTGFPLHIIPKAAHNSNYDNSEVVNKAIDDFLKGIL